MPWRLNTGLDDPREPWEKPGQVRRDCEPHRGEFVLLLGGISLAFGVSALCSGLGGLIALPAGIAAVWLAWSDLARMDTGVMDPSGEAKTLRGLYHGLIGIALSLLCLMFWGSFWMVMRH